MSSKRKLKVGDVVEFRKIEGPVMVVNSSEKLSDEIEVLFVEGSNRVNGRYVKPKLLRRIKK